MEEKSVYFFGNGKADGRADMKELLGGKGANLAEMTKIAIPVPAGFTITTEICTNYYTNGSKIPDMTVTEVKAAIKQVEVIMGCTFGSKNNPLLLSVRSGAPVSMPGMMDTILNLGMNDQAVQGLIEQTKNERFAYDSYRRFIQMYSNVVLNLDMHLFENCLEKMKQSKGVVEDTELDGRDLKNLTAEYLQIVKKELKTEFPQDPWDQLWGAVGAVFHSWHNKRAQSYRKINKIPSDWGTAVNVQAMVFGNMGNDCATGVAFTRNPSTGTNAFFGEYLINAQGEDVVAGIRTPLPINDAPNSLEEVMPEAYRELYKIQTTLESHYTEMQDIEFTIQNGHVWLLQTRTGKRTPAAAVKIAVDMVLQGLISKETAIKRVKPEQLEFLLHPTLDPNAKKKILAKGLPASPGAAVGKAVFDADRAESMHERGEKVILVRTETSPEDIHGMYAAEGILTARGGMTSHAAVVARGMGKPCVAGCGSVHIDESTKTAEVAGLIIKEGDMITLDGSEGLLILGVVPTVEPTLSGDFGTLMNWADEIRQMNVRANADTPKDCITSREFGAEGIGLTRTEHMFFAPERIALVREVILSSSQKQRQKALDAILPMQKEDFKGIFKAMNGLPVTIRLLDPPLHEFLPKSEKELIPLAKQMNISLSELKKKVESMAEFNPMLGHRGCRLGVTMPEIYVMQTQAIIEAACELKEMNIQLFPEIMIPLIAHVNELKMLRQLVKDTASKVMQKLDISIDYMIGTMIELPRAALTADEIALEADFFSFGTNDLTQTTFGLSRDDSEKFLPEYVEKGLLPGDPFVSIDVNGVGELVKIATEKGRKENPTIKIGICGEHGGDPASVTFCHNIGLEYVSCSPYRIPIARLAAAHAAIDNPRPVQKPFVATSATELV